MYQPNLVKAKALPGLSVGLLPVGFLEFLTLIPIMTQSQEESDTEQFMVVMARNELGQEYEFRKRGLWVILCRLGVTLTDSPRAKQKFV